MTIPYIHKAIGRAEAEAVRQIRHVPNVKTQDSAIISSRRATALKRINDMQAELGRMSKLLDEMRADMLHLTVE